MKELEAIRKLAPKWRTAEWQWPKNSSGAKGPVHCADELEALLPALEKAFADKLVSCARCNEMKECLLIETGFAGEHEPMCARCLSKERIDSINDNAEEVATLRAEITALREPMSCTHPRACWQATKPDSVDAVVGYRCVACEDKQLAVAVALQDAAAICKAVRDDEKEWAFPSMRAMHLIEQRISPADAQALDAHDAALWNEALEEAAQIADAEFVSYHDAASRIRALKREKRGGE